MAKNKKQEELEQQVGELTADLQRTRADFENYRKRAEQEKEMARGSGRASAILKLLPVVDNIERALAHLPENLKNDPWANSVVKLTKNLEKSLNDMGVQRIDAAVGGHFDPDLHDAVQFDENAEGEHEIIAEELQPGYKIDGIVMRPSMVKVTRQ
ncbi:MAG TPA: nucleotide exchange factor GrpE [Candidatus Saccharibacteria bacterium]|nr:nucleotide exchange factor GrpE [Candidatus Saccharibacteria bacterium]HRK93857.1 nucleotide exchange factor GrpE [Candidatus Saccharibacteria bacterium]